MRTIFDNRVREQLIARIKQLDEGKQPLWGKMTVLQMLRHNTYWNGWILGKDGHLYKQTFLGKLFGKIALRRMIKDDKPFDRNIPTSAQFLAKDKHGNLEVEKANWIVLLEAYQDFNNPEFIHDFFGKMTKKQIGILAYKHTDHHLRQFRV